VQQAAPTLLSTKVENSALHARPATLNPWKTAGGLIIPATPAPERLSGRPFFPAKARVEQTTDVSEAEPVFVPATQSADESNEETIPTRVEIDRFATAEAALPAQNEMRQNLNLFSQSSPVLPQTQATRSLPSTRRTRKMSAASGQAEAFPTRPGQARDSRQEERQRTSIFARSQNQWPDLPAYETAHPPVAEWDSNDSLADQIEAEDAAQPATQQRAISGPLSSSAEWNATAHTRREVSHAVYRSSFKERGAYAAAKPVSPQTTTGNRLAEQSVEMVGQSVPTTASIRPAAPSEAASEFAALPAMPADWHANGSLIDFQRRDSADPNPRQHPVSGNEQGRNASELEPDFNSAWSEAVWPSLPDDQPGSVQSWHATRQFWEHRQRLDNEQRGNVWNA
jgi:hypothetical protein